MKRIEAIIRKTKFEDVKEALLQSDIDWFEYHNVHGIGQSREERIYRGINYILHVKRFGEIKKNFFFHTKTLSY